MQISFCRNNQNSLTRFVLVQTRLFNTNLMKTGKAGRVVFAYLLVAYGKVYYTNEAFSIDTSILSLSSTLHSTDFDH